MRSAAWVAALAAAALLWGTAVTVWTDGAGWPWYAAPAAVAVLAGALGWLRRGRATAPTFGLAFVLSYAAIAGLALVRFAELDPGEASALVYPYTARWPAIAIGGIPFALMCASFVALPAALIPSHKRRPSGNGERFWAFIHEREDTARASAPQSSGAASSGT